MAVECIVSGDTLEVARDGKTYSLSLAVPIDRLSVWLDLDNDDGFAVLHQKIRDDVMGPAAQKFVGLVEQVDGIDAMEVTRSWSVALRGRMGKALSLSLSGDSTEPTSPPTSGSDTE